MKRNFDNWVTHHDRPWRGFGPVADCEKIAFAVFSDREIEETKLKDESQNLIYKAWNLKQLKRCEHSVARIRFTSKKTFDRCVIQPNKKRGNSFVGVCAAHVEKVRRLDFWESSGPPFRAFQVLDRVSTKDFDGHASIGYTKWPSLPPTKLSAIRAQVHLDLTRQFVPLTSVSKHCWGSLMSILFGRFRGVSFMAVKKVCIALTLLRRRK